MSRLCLDTSAYSHFRRGTKAVVDLVDTARFIYVPAVVLGELRAGFSRGRQQQENEAALRQFLADPVVAVLAVDDEAASCYAELWSELRQAGTPIPTNDLWVAAVARREGAVVVTYDRHFDYVRGVGVRRLES